MRREMGRGPIQTEDVKVLNSNNEEKVKPEDASEPGIYCKCSGVASAEDDRGSFLIKHRSNADNQVCHSNHDVNADYQVCHSTHHMEKSQWSLQKLVKREQKPRHLSA
ncbi:hypothetical protein STEG23_032209 [Scotinomys teguina]